MEREGVCEEVEGTSSSPPFTPERVWDGVGVCIPLTLLLLPPPPNGREEEEGMSGRPEAWVCVRMWWRRERRRGSIGGRGRERRRGRGGGGKWMMKPAESWDGVD